MNKKITITIGMLLGIVSVIVLGVWFVAHWHMKQQAEDMQAQHQQQQMKDHVSNKRVKAKSLAELALKYYKEKHPQSYLAQRAFFALIDIQEIDENDLIKHLLDTKLVDVDAYNDRGQTALFYVASKGNIELVTLLLEHGAKPNQHSEHGSQIALNGALINVDVVKVLLEHEADPNVQMNDGTTVLMHVLIVLEKAFAVLNPQHTIEQCKKIIDFLLAYGANPMIADKQGKSAMDYLSNLKELYSTNKVVSVRFNEQDRNNMLRLCKEIEVEFVSRGKVTN